MTNTAIPSDAAPMLGDHLALDLLNTEARQDGATVDYWRDGEGVLRWLAQHGVALPLAAPAPGPGQLLAQATALRTLARRLIAARRNGDALDQGDIDALNGYLHAYLSAPSLERDADGAPVLARVTRAAPLAALLGPVAQALAQLLAEGDFGLVKQCEHPDCILWFYDRTKAHKRRWCSMSTCGNRHKAAQFRLKAGAAKA
jgi:predicted RNA-binding Zn ribbon-like protein